MVRRRGPVLIIVAALAAAAVGRAGELAAADEPRWHETLAAAAATFRIEEITPGTSYKLPHRFLFAGAETVRLGEEVWTRGRDYRIDYDAGVLTVLAPPPYAGPLVVTYEYLPFLQAEEYEEALAGEEEAAALERIEEGAAGSQLDITGSKTFSISSGNAAGTDFDQSLRLSVRGNVGDVKVTGDISDQDIPLEEGGATEEVAALDKISVRVEGRHLAGTFGDYDVAAGGRRFADYERRLTGIKAEAFYPSWQANGYGARARGRFASVELYGLDGVQGPYQLSARGDENIIILPGTEAVWLNGVRLKEGENNDYLIDYDLATITFQVRQPISAEDRIVVDFQYTTEEYQRNFFGGDAEGHFADDALNVGALYVHEEDNRDRDLFGLTDVQRHRFLPLVGDDLERARVVVRDEEGNIIYEYVGPGQGEYTREWDPQEGKYVYTYVGPGNGDYSAKTVLLPLPKRQSLLDLTATLVPARLLTVEAEGATSDLDRNTFSTLGDDDNTGLAGTATTTLHLDALELFAPLGELEVRHTVETRDGRFQNIGRDDDVAFLQNWDLEDEVAGLARPPAQNIYETTVIERPVPSLELSASYGALRHRYVGLSAGGYRDQYGERVAGTFLWEPERGPRLGYDYNGVRRRGRRGAPPPEATGEMVSPAALSYDENTRREQNGKISYSFWRLSPYVRIYDKKRAADYHFDGVADAGTIEQELEVGTGVQPAAGWGIHFGHTAGRGRKVVANTFAPYYRKSEENVTSSYDYPGLLNISAEYTRSKKDFVSDADEDVNADLSLLDVYYTPLARALALKMRYELDNVQEREREEVFEVAEDGDGDYRREPDPKNPSRYIYIYDPDDRDAIYVKNYRYTGRAFRVLQPDLTVDLDLRPYRLNDAKAAAAPRNRWLDAAAVELYVHARNNSTSPRRVAVAMLQNLLAADALESSLEQRYTLTLLPVHRRLTGTLRYSKKDDLDRTVAPRQSRKWRTSRFAEVVTEPARRWTVVADVERVRERDAVVEENVPYPEDTLASEMIYGLEPTYDLTAQLEVKTRAELSRRHEDYNGAATDIAGLKLKPEVTYRLAESGVINCWYERTRYDVAGYLGSETLLLRVPGLNHKWEASVNKGVGQYVTLVFTYDGERQADEDVTSHRGRVDVNIYF